MTDHWWIETVADLPRVVEACRTAPWLALDSEANSMFVYREQMCLLQLNAGGQLIVVDMVALLKAEGWDGSAPSHVLDSLKTELSRTDRPLWLHGGEYDCALLKRDFGITPAGVWDTQQAASLLGWPATGYGAVVEKLCAVTLEKAFTQYDWATRPLDPGALQYALDDVVHLPKCAEILKAEVATADLVEEHAIACQAVTESTSGAGFDPAGFWKIKGLRDLPKDCHGVLAALYVWRDGIAREANLPPGRIINNESLLIVAKYAPLSFQQLKKAGLKSWVLSQHGEAIIDTIRSAKEQPPAIPEQPRRREVDDAEEDRETRLKDWRRSESERRKVPLQVVLPAKAIEHLKRYGADDLSAVPQLGPKRIGLYGEKIVTLCR